MATSDMEEPRRKILRKITKIIKAPIFQENILIQIAYASSKRGSKCTCWKLLDYRGEIHQATVSFGDNIACH